MNDYISRYDAMLVPPLPKEYREYTTMNLDDAYELGWDDALQNLKNVPAADVRPVVRGHWFMISYDEAGCSCCGYDRSTPFESTREAKERWNELPPFCEMCGADMRKESNGNEGE